MKTLLSPYVKNGLRLQNHIVMAPMTRSRAIGNIPNELMAGYYGQRAGAGLIITEGTAPEASGLGYPRIPGIFSAPQVEGWQKVTASVHKGGAGIFVQLMHTGRIGHKDNLPEGVELVGASGIKAAGRIITDTKGMQDYSEPAPLTGKGINAVIEGYVTAAKNAVTAGFDGVELHSANGYLPEQFLNPHVNNRIDEYGGGIVNRSRFILQIAEKVARAIGREKVGIRFSPYSTLGDLAAYPEDEVHETYTYLAAELNRIGITYIHISVNPALAQRTVAAIRSGFTGTIILCNGLTPETAEEKLQNGVADLVAFGRSFLANPDLVQRIESGAPLNQPDFSTLYTPGARGYTDYPVMAQTEAV
jgi:N-ethylmaleimide reductase